MSKPVQIKALIFDLDGVIVDTAKYHFKSWQKLAHSIGAELTEEQNEQLKGVSRMQSLEQILFWNSIDLQDEHMTTLAALKNTWYQSMIEQMGPGDGLPGAVEFIEEAKSAGLKTALGSASRNASTILRSLKIEHLFDAVIDGNNTTKSKPDPQVFLLGAEALKVAPEETIVFEDSIRGLEAAVEGGFHTVGVGDHEQLDQADWVIAGLGDIEVKQLLDKFQE